MDKQQCIWSFSVAESICSCNGWQQAGRHLFFIMSKIQILQYIKHFLPRSCSRGGHLAALAGWHGGPNSAPDLPSSPGLLAAHPSGPLQGQSGRWPHHDLICKVTGEGRSFRWQFILLNHVGSVFSFVLCVVLYFVCFFLSTTFISPYSEWTDHGLVWKRNVSLYIRSILWFLLLWASFAACLQLYVHALRK